MTPKEYLAYANSQNEADFHVLSDLIDKLSHEERRKLRDQLEEMGCTKLIRNLYFDYELQVWI